MKDLDREEIIEVLQDELEGIMDDVSDTYESNDSPEGEELEYKARSGFSPHTDGGYKYTFLSFAKHLEGAGIDLPTKVLQDRVDEFSKNADEHAQSEIWQEAFRIKDEDFKDKFPTKEDVNYSDLEDFDSEYAEEFDEIVREYRDDESILFSIEAMYYKPENDNGEDGKNTITLSGSVNLETPYHRRGFYEDFKEITFTFSSLESLEKKLRNELEVIKSWFDGSDYKTSTTELKQGRLENGGKVYGSSYQDEVEDRVRDLTEQEYEVFAFDNQIDPEDANEMSDFISDLNQDEANKIILQLRGDDNYAKGGMISVKDTLDEAVRKLTPNQKKIYNKHLERTKKLGDSFTDKSLADYVNGWYGEDVVNRMDFSGVKSFNLGYKVVAMKMSQEEDDFGEFAKGGAVSWSSGEVGLARLQFADTLYSLDDDSYVHFMNKNGFEQIEVEGNDHQIREINSFIDGNNWTEKLLSKQDMKDYVKEIEEEIEEDGYRWRDDETDYKKGGKVKKGNEMIMGGLAGVLLGFLLNK